MKALSLLSNIDLAEKELLKHTQVSCPVVHRFGPGVYIREVLIPAGALAIGHHQNFEHTNIFLKGCVTILNDDGSTSKLRAPMIFVGKPGRKIGYVHEDIVWLNVYATDETDVEKLETQILTKSDGWIESVEAQKSLKLLKSEVDAKDYGAVLKEFGFTEQQARSMSENTLDLIDLPYGGYKIKVAKSNIEGQGLFATADIEPNEIIAPARVHGKRTIAGRFPNHSVSPNAKMLKGRRDEIDLVAIKKIMGCHGGIDGEEITINYRESLNLTLEIGRGG